MSRAALRAGKPTVMEGAKRACIRGVRRSITREGAQQAPYACHEGPLTGWPLASKKRPMRAGAVMKRHSALAGVRYLCVGEAGGQGVRLLSSGITQDELKRLGAIPNLFPF